MFYTEYNFFKINFIDPASPLMYGIIELHDHIFFFLNMILFLVLFLLFTTIKYFTYNRATRRNKYLLSQSTKLVKDWLKLSHGTTIEIIWTVVPSLILILIAIPSFALLYATDELVDPSLTIQVIGHQWYWSYEYNDLIAIETVPQLKKFSYSSFINSEATQNVLAAFENDTELYKRCALKYNNLKYYNNFSFNNVDGPSSNLMDLISQYNIMKAGTPRLYEFMGIDDVFLSKKFLATRPNPDDFLLNMDTNFKKYEISEPDLVKFLNGTIEFDSYMRQESDLAKGDFRLYETDFPLVLPKFTHIRFMITADDVIHSWSVPALGIKVDAVPGRINHAHTYIKYSGIFYGQCSELCGVNHAFMPIQILVFEPSLYYDYIRLMLLSK